MKQTVYTYRFQTVMPLKRIVSFFNNDFLNNMDQQSQMPRSFLISDELASGFLGQYLKEILYTKEMICAF